MAALKTHMLKALNKRQAAIAAHHAGTLRQAGLAATARTLADGAAAAAKMPPAAARPPTQKGATQ